MQKTGGLTHTPMPQSSYPMLLLQDMEDVVMLVRQGEPGEQIQAFGLLHKDVQRKESVLLWEKRDLIKHFADLNSFCAQIKVVADAGR